ncbi:MAG: hypothetical protein LBL80_03180 [Ruminococcus sp.]|nr:hypothetical protein [Ruminococcus sp.]
MNFKKIIAAVVTGALALSAMAIPASAANTALPGGSKTADAAWNDQYSQYSINVGTLTGGAPSTVFGIKLYFGSDNISAETTAGVVARNGATVSWSPFGNYSGPAKEPLEANVIGNDGTLTFLDETSPFVDGEGYSEYAIQCFYVGEGSTLSINGFDLLAADGSVVYSTGATALDPAAAPAETEAAPAETEAAPAETEAAPAETEAAAEEAPVVEEAPAVDEAVIVDEAPAADEVIVVAEAPAAEATPAPATGNVPAMVIGGVMIAALAGAVISRKKK